MKWISVKEWLPNFNEQVFVYMGDDWYDVARLTDIITHEDAEGTTVTFEWRDYVFNSIEPTHWCRPTKP